MKAVILFADKMVTKFMQDTDVFESSKVIGNPLIHATVVEDWGKPHFDKMLSLNSSSPYATVAVVTEKGVFADPKIKSVSNGFNFATIDSVIEQMKRELVSWVAQPEQEPTKSTESAKTPRPTQRDRKRKPAR
jgi:hypothetical protein